MENTTLKKILDSVLSKKHKNWIFRDSSKIDSINEIFNRIKRIVFNKQAVSKNTVIDVIKKLLESSEKDELNIDYLFNYLDNRRLRHSLICYLYGCYIYNNISSVKKNVDESIGYFWSNSNRSSCSKFLLSWMLICLFHDIGYSVEKEDNIKRLLPNDDFRIEDILFLENRNQLTNFLPQFPEKYIPKCYENTIVKYDVYRKIRNLIIEDRTIFDHGIYGGISLSESLKNHNFQHDNYMPQQYYGYLSWVVIVHNIWFAYEEYCQFIYSNYGLKELCINNEDYKIKLDEAPFLWLLSIVDNLECTKRRISAKWLTHITINLLNKDKLIITISPEISKKRYFNKYIKSLQDLNNWLTNTTVSLK
ncbi:MAG: hypothetical protein SPL47_01565 [Bacteroidales bacterium]|nr:hypothetical protein [Bacteroidales bacterium]